jgi:hypothetical protein
MGSVAPQGHGACVERQRLGGDLRHRNSGEPNLCRQRALVLASALFESGTELERQSCSDSAPSCSAYRKPKPKPISAATFPILRRPA